MATAIINVEIHGRTVEVGCYGAATDWVCRLSDASSQRGPHNDAYCPPADLGFVWLRESDNMWLASGLVNREVFRNADTVDLLLAEVMHDVIHDDSQLARCIEFVDANFTATFNGEEGPAQFSGSAEKSRGRQSRE